MKIYEKPMALIENIEVEDVITASGTTNTDEIGNIQAATGDDTANVKSAIIFEW